MHTHFINNIDLRFKLLRLTINDNLCKQDQFLTHFSYVCKYMYAPEEPLKIASIEVIWNGGFDVEDNYGLQGLELYFIYSISVHIIQNLCNLVSSTEENIGFLL